MVVAFHRAVATARPFSVNLSEMFLFHVNSSFNFSAQVFTILSSGDYIVLFK